MPPLQSCPRATTTKHPHSINRTSSASEESYKRRLEVLRRQPCGAWQPVPPWIRCGIASARSSGSAYGRFRWSSSSWPSRTSCLQGARRVGLVRKMWHGMNDNLSNLEVKIKVHPSGNSFHRSNGFTLLYREMLTLRPRVGGQSAQNSEGRITTTTTMVLTGAQTSRWVSTLRASVLLDVVRRPATTTAQRVRLIVALSKARCTFRLQGERRDEIRISVHHVHEY